MCVCLREGERTLLLREENEMKKKEREKKLINLIVFAFGARMIFGRLMGQSRGRRTRRSLSNRRGDKKSRN